MRWGCAGVQARALYGLEGEAINHMSPAVKYVKRTRFLLLGLSTPILSPHSRFKPSDLAATACARTHERIGFLC